MNSSSLIVLCINSRIEVTAKQWNVDQGKIIKQIGDFKTSIGRLVGLNINVESDFTPRLERKLCHICGWFHEPGFAQIKSPGHDTISLAGVLPEIVSLVHHAHEKGFPALSTKDEELLNLCGGYRNPCKAFHDLKHPDDYKKLFNTRRRGFIALYGTNRNISKSNSE